MRNNRLYVCTYMQTYKVITPVANNHHNTYADDFFASRLTGARSVLMAKLVRMCAAARLGQRLTPVDGVG